MCSSFSCHPIIIFSYSMLLKISAFSSVLVAAQICLVFTLYIVYIHAYNNSKCFLFVHYDKGEISLSKLTCFFFLKWLHLLWRKYVL